MPVKINLQLLCVVTMLSVLQQQGLVFAVSQENVREILSIKTGGSRPNNTIGNQFAGVPEEPNNGFAVDSKGNIFISDTPQSRIMRFSKDAVFSGQLTVEQNSSFYPEKFVSMTRIIFTP